MSTSLDSIRQCWPDLIKKVGAKLGMRLVACEPVAVEDGKLSFRAKNGYQGIADRCADAENIERLELVLRRMFLCEMQATCVHTEPGHSPSPVTTDELSPAAPSREIAVRIRQEGPCPQGLREAIEIIRESGAALEVVPLASCDYGLYLKTSHWKEKRAAALAQWGSRCCVCNSADGLDVHHRTYERRGNEAPSDLVVLCRTCHRLFHDNGRIGKPKR